jgi:hypothetical protein
MYAIIHPEPNKPLIPIQELSIAILYSIVHGGEVVRLADGAMLRRVDGLDVWVQRDYQGYKESQNPTLAHAPANAAVERVEGST